MAFGVENENKKKVHPPKQPIKFNLTLSQEQKEAKPLIISTPVSFLLGPVGSGKCLAGEAKLELQVSSDFYQFLKSNKYIEEGDGFC